MAQQRPKRLSWKSYLILVVTLFGGSWIYQRIWGFGGFYTHVNYIPAPENLTEDDYTTPFDIDAANKYFRRYDVELTLDELVVFKQQALPEAGWSITKQGPVTLNRGEIAHCFIIEQHSVKGYITIREGVEPTTNRISSAVIISLYEPMSVPWCAEDQF